MFWTVIGLRVYEQLVKLFSTDQCGELECMLTIYSLIWSNATYTRESSEEARLVNMNAKKNREEVKV